MTVLLAIGLVAAGFAALVHVYIFVLESLRWMHPSTRRIFGVQTDAEAEATRPLAFNQGFYNLFLALTVLTGIALTGIAFEAGAALVLAGTGSMVLAAIVLIASRRDLARAAAVQGVLPAIAIVLVAAGLETGARAAYDTAGSSGLQPLEVGETTIGLPSGDVADSFEPFAVVGEGSELIVVTFGSSSCPSRPVAFDPAAESLSISTEPTGGEVCTSDIAPASTPVTVPDGFAPVTALRLNGDPVRLVAS